MVNAKIFESNTCIYLLISKLQIVVELLSRTNTMISFQACYKSILIS